METFAFDSNWHPIAEEDESTRYRLIRLDNGAARIQVNGYYHSPQEFGKHWPYRSAGFAEIEKFLKPIEQSPEFQESWERFRAKIDLARDVQYLTDEVGNSDTFTTENVEIFAKLFVACYPFTAHFSEMSNYLYDGHYGPPDYNVEYRFYLSAIDYKELVKGVTGVWRKDVARELHGMRLAQIQLINEFANYVTVENLVEAMSAAQGVDRVSDYYDSDFEVIALLQPSVRVRLLKELISERKHNDEQINVSDTLNMVSIVGPHKQFRGCKNWKDLHDTAMRLAPTVKNSDKVTAPKVLEGMSELEIDGYTFLSLTEASEFVELGETLKICIGKAGYYYKALRGDSYCMSVLKNGLVVGALEVNQDKKKQWRVAQLYGYDNSLLDDTVALTNAIVENLNSDNLEKVLERV